MAHTPIHKDGVSLMTTLFHRTSRPSFVRQGLGIALAVVAMASRAHAHGGMAGPDELGPPLVTSAILAFVCYWVVILWPTSKRTGSEGTPNKRQAPEGERRSAPRRTYKRASVKPTAQLRKVGSGRGENGFDTARKASDV